MREMKTIEAFTERIHKAKTLLLDGHIEFQHFKDIKSDLEAKIRLMGYSIDAYSKSQTELVDKVKAAATLLAKPGEFLEMLDDQNRHAFLNHILNRKQKWAEGNLNQIFKEPFRVIYGLENGNKTTEKEVSELLQNICDMELLIRN